MGKVVVRGKGYIRNHRIVVEGACRCWLEIQLHAFNRRLQDQGIDRRRTNK